MLSKGIKMKPEIELGSHELLLEFAKINLGISCVIKRIFTRIFKKWITYEVKLTEEIPKRSIGICFLKNISLSPSSTNLLKY